MVMLFLRLRESLNHFTSADFSLQNYNFFPKLRSKYEQLT